MKSTRVLLSVLISVAFISCSNDQKSGVVQNNPKKTEPESFLVPTDFRGKVHILHSESCGTEKEYEMRRRLYRIPENGILLSQFNLEDGLVDHEYYLTDSLGNRTQLRSLDITNYNKSSEKDQSLKNEIGVFRLASGVGQHRNEGEYHFTEFYIGTVAQYRACLNKQYENQFDSLEYHLIIECRGKTLE
jgi:hypothetical protein